MEQRTGGGNVGSRSSNGNRDLASQAQDQLGELRERFGDLGEQVAGFVRERPGTSILIAVGAGFLIGRMLRS